MNVRKIKKSMKRVIARQQDGARRTVQTTVVRSIGHGLMLVPVGVLASSLAFASPQGGSVVSGTGTIQQATATQTLVTQQTKKMAIDWQTFNLAVGDTVRFAQPSASASVLNRILDQNPSQIFGSIQANGRVFLVNPNGIIFGESSTVNVGSLVATTLNINAQDFMLDGACQLGDADTSAGGAIINRGLISAATGGTVTLVGGSVSNEGVIHATLGHVNLASGRTAVLDFDGDGLLSFAVDGDVLANTTGAASAVANSGTVLADGGEVLLSGHAAKDVFSNVVNNKGVIQANSIDTSNGTIRLVGGESGIVANSGTLRAKGDDGGEKGGSVQMLGEKVGLLDQGSIDVSGDAGGGTALVGGDYQGNNPDIRNASNTYVGAEASIDASATGNGDGGRVIVWADDTTRFYGSIAARGGAQSGDGGFVEVSGKGVLIFTGTADRRAPHGLAGTLLLDPSNIEISTTDTADVLCSGGTCFSDVDPSSVSYLQIDDLEIALAGGDVNVNASIGAGAGAGVINWTNGTVNASAHSLTLTGATILFNGTLVNVDSLTFVGATPTGSGSATSSTGTGAITGLGSTAFNLTGSTGSTSGTAGSIAFSGFTAADTATVTGALGFDDATKSSRGMAFVNATSVTGTGAISNVTGSFADDTLISVASGIAYTGFTAVAGTGTALTGIGSSFNDSTKVSGSGIDYSGLASLATVAGDGTADVTHSASFALTGVNAGTGVSGIAYSAFNAASNTTTVTGATGFDDTAKSNQGITFAAVTTVAGTGTALTGVGSSFNDSTKFSGSGIDYSGLASLATVAGDGTADVTHSASFALTGVNAGMGVSGIAYSAFNAASNTTAVTGATGFDDTAKSSQGMIFADATSVTGAGTIINVADSFADDTLISEASHIDYAGFTAVAGTGTALTGINGSFDDTTLVSVASGVDYTGFDLKTVTGAGTALTGVGSSFNDGTKVSGSGIDYSGLASLATVAGAGTIINVTGSFADDTLISAASHMDYAGFTAVAGTGTALTGINGSFDDTTLVSVASGVDYTGFDLKTIAGTGTALTGVGSSFNDGTKVSGSGIDYSGLASLATVAGAGTIINVADSFADDTLISEASHIDYAGFTAVAGTGTALTGMNGSFDDTTLVSVASGVDYIGFDLKTVTGAGTALTGVGSSFNDGTKVSGSGIDYSGLASLATVAGDGTADVTHSASFALTGVNAGTGASGIAYSAFNEASYTTTVTGAIGFDVATKSSRGMAFVNASSVTGTGAITGLGSTAFNLTGWTLGTADSIAFSGFTAADTTTVKGASGFDDTTKTSQGMVFANATTVTGTGTIVNVMGDFAIDTLISTDSLINYAGFTSVVGTGDGTLTGAGQTYSLNNTIANKGSNGSVGWTGFGNITDSGAGIFKMGTAGSVTGNLTARGGTLNYSSYGRSVLMNQQTAKATGIGGTFNGIATVVGNGAPTTLIGLNAGETFTLSGVNAGIAGSLAFTGVGNLVGSGDSDTITGAGRTYMLTDNTPNAGSSGAINWTSIENVEDVTGTVNFQASGSVTGNVTADTLNYSGYGNIVTFDLANAAHATTGIDGIWSGVQHVDANTANAAMNTIMGSDADEIFTLSGTNEGTVGSLAFTGMGHLVGGGGDDSFVGNVGSSLSGSLTDNGGTTTLRGDLTTNGMDLDNDALIIQANVNAGGGDVYLTANYGDINNKKPVQYTLTTTGNLYVTTDSASGKIYLNVNVSAPDPDGYITLNTQNTVDLTGVYTRSKIYNPNNVSIVNSAFDSILGGEMGAKDNGNYYIDPALFNQQLALFTPKDQGLKMPEDQLEEVLGKYMNRLWYGMETASWKIEDSGGSRLLTKNP